MTTFIRARFVPRPNFFQDFATLKSTRMKMLICLLWLVCSGFILNEEHGNNDSVYILFTSKYPRTYFKINTTPKGNFFMGIFSLDKTASDGCPFNTFWFPKNYLEKTVIVKVKTDTLQNVLTSEWVATQPDTVLIRLFKHKNIYVIPKDSLKANVGNAYLTIYGYCEIE